ncbi:MULTISPECIES: hypothetical protein [unclassified Mesorhizobium]|uniref:hypothetical protein n=1 Tax=unclassified Mesorhizobium TaxID=325217 RepID=UPI003338B035
MIDACYLIEPDACFVFRNGLMTRPAYIKAFGDQAFHALPKFDRAVFSSDRPQMQAVWLDGIVCLDLGVQGALAILIAAEQMTDKDTDWLFRGGNGSDRDRWWEWTVNLGHLFNATEPASAEARSSLATMWMVGKPVYTALGFDPPVWIIREAARAAAQMAVDAMVRQHA